MRAIALLSFAFAFAPLAGACAGQHSQPVRGAATTSHEPPPLEALLGNDEPRPLSPDDMKAHEGACRVELRHPTSVPGIRFFRSYDSRGRELTRETVVPQRRQRFADVACSSRAISSYDAAGALIAIATDKECWHADTKQVWHEPCSMRIGRDERGRIREIVYAYTLRGEPERMRILYDYDARGVRRAQRTYEPSTVWEIETERFRHDGNVTERSITQSFLASDEPGAPRKERRTKIVYERDERGRVARITESDLGGCKGSTYVWKYTYDEAGRLKQEDGEMTGRPSIEALKREDCDSGFREPTQTVFSYDEAGRFVRVGPAESKDAMPILRYAADGRIESFESSEATTQLVYSGTCPTPVSDLVPRAESHTSGRRQQLDLDLNLPSIDTIEGLSDTRVYSGIWQFR